MVDKSEKTEARSCGWCGRGAQEAAALRYCRKNPQCTRAVREHRAALFPALTLTQEAQSHD